METAKRKQFQLFQTPLDLAHAYWKKLLKIGDIVIDATCGNGHDTVFLANLILDDTRKGYLIAMDIQEQAIENTRDRLHAKFSPDLHGIEFVQQCHSSFSPHLKNESVTLIVYNLGYLPGADKNLTTFGPTTLKSLTTSLPLIAPGGAISITCYPGHDAGKVEAETALTFAASLDPIQWSSCHHQWANRKNAPSLILIQRAL